MCGIFDMSSNRCMLCGHGSNNASHLPLLTAHHPSNCLGICDLTVAMAKINTQLVLECIAAMGDDAFVMRQLDRIRQPSSAETGADVIKEFLVWIWQMCQLDLLQFYLPSVLPFSLDTFQIICLTNDYCWSCLGQCFMPVRCLCSWALSEYTKRPIDCCNCSDSYFHFSNLCRMNSEWRQYKPGSFRVHHEAADGHTCLRFLGSVFVHLCMCHGLVKWHWGSVQTLEQKFQVGLCSFWMCVFCQYFTWQGLHNVSSLEWTCQWGCWLLFKHMCVCCLCFWLPPAGFSMPFQFRRPSCDALLFCCPRSVQAFCCFVDSL